MAKGNLNSGYFKAVPHPGGISGSPHAVSQDMMDETDKVMGEGHIEGTAQDAMGSDQKATTVIGSAKATLRGGDKIVGSAGQGGSVDPQVKGLAGKGQSGSTLPAGNPGGKVGKGPGASRTGNQSSAVPVKGLNIKGRSGSQTSAGNPGAKVGKGK